MNIQLRDSKGLQTALYKETKRSALPKAKLHPELIEGVVDIEAGGFIVRSEASNDVKIMELFLPSPASCDAAWKMTGGTTPIPSELIFAFQDNSKLVIRTQAVGDVTRLTSSIPSDRRASFDASYHDGSITLVRTSIEKGSPLTARSDGELQLEAAKRGVKWDKKASRETMIERLEQAKKPETANA